MVRPVLETQEPMGPAGIKRKEIEGVCLIPLSEPVILALSAFLSFFLFFSREAKHLIFEN